jgi:amidase
MLSVIAGRDELDDTSLNAPLDDYAAAIEAGANGIRVGVDENYIARAASAVSSEIGDLERVGARILKVKLPDVEPCLSTWTTLCASEAAAGHVATYPSRATDYGPGFGSFLELGASIRGQDYANAHMVRESCAIFREFSTAEIPGLPLPRSYAHPPTLLPPTRSTTHTAVDITFNSRSWRFRGQPALPQSHFADSNAPSSARFTAARSREMR